MSSNPTPSARICSLHFLPNDFDNSKSRPQLYDSAIPSLQLTNIYYANIAVPSASSARSNPREHTAEEWTVVRLLKIKNKNLRRRLNALQQVKKKVVQSKKSSIEQIRVAARKYRKQVELRHQDADKFKNKLSQQKLHYETSLLKIFSKKQVNVILMGKQHAKWSNEDIARGISLRYKANAYECL